MSETSALVDELEAAVDSGDLVGARRRLSLIRERIDEGGVAVAPEVLARALSVVARSSVMSEPPSGSNAPGALSLVDRIVELAQESRAKPGARLDAEAIEETTAQLRSAIAAAPRPIGDGPAEKALNALRGVKAFEQLAKLGDVLISSGSQSMVVHRLTAHALIEAGHVQAAIKALESLLQEPLDEKDHIEILGGLGRAHKQIYVDHVGSTRLARAKRERFAPHLQASIDSYARALDIAPPSRTGWARINLVAVMALAKRDAVAIKRPPGVGEPAELAAALAADIPLDKNDPWTTATLAEANLALGRYRAAAELYDAFATHPDVDAFMVGSALKQLQTVWRIEAAPHGKGLSVLALQDGLLGSSGPGAFTVSASAVEATVEAPVLETMTSGGTQMPFQSIMKLYQAGCGVARVLNKDTAGGGGTGFLIRGGDLHPSLGDALFILTNAHVVHHQDDRAPHRNAMPPSQAAVRFDALETTRHFLVEPQVVWSRPATERQHDATILRLKESPPRDARPLELDLRDGAFSAGARADLEDGTRVVTLGHPNGGELHLGVREGLFNGAKGNVVGVTPQWTEGEAEYVHYDAPTEPGNSGSPVIEMLNYKAIALHHAGFQRRFGGQPRLDGPGFYEANQGVSLRSIQKAMAVDLGGQSGGRRRGGGLFGRG